ncbi:MAG: DUF2069 domain-containing protein [Zoogloeaceae bacterium]|jgi:uncharacterized membrane protein|nr:DUF2069 domain-containing protein [Zoogloeaceae bacterium]
MNSTPAPDRRLVRLRLMASASLIILIFYCLAWELRLAPIQPGGSWLALKALPLLLPLTGILNGRRYTYQVATLLILLYLMEGLVRVSSDTGASRWFALGEVLLSLVFFMSAAFFARFSRQRRQVLRKDQRLTCDEDGEKNLRGNQKP